MQLSLEDQAKRTVGFHAVDTYVAPDTCIGLGTGTTAYWAIERVGQLVARGLHVRAVATSGETERLCRERAIPLIAFGDETLDVAIDGADKTDGDRTLIKGGGGALYREKAVALAAKRFIVCVTDRKVVERLGAFPLPVEVVPFSSRVVVRAIEALGASVVVRQRDGAPYVTDNGNVLLDCTFGRIDDAGELDRRLRDILGVVTTGLFVGIAARVLVANVDGSMSEI